MCTVKKIKQSDGASSLAKKKKSALQLGRKGVYGVIQTPPSALSRSLSRGSTDRARSQFEAERENFWEVDNNTMSQQLSPLFCSVAPASSCFSPKVFFFLSISPLPPLKLGRRRRSDESFCSSSVQSSSSRSGRACSGSAQSSPHLCTHPRTCRCCTR